MEALLAWAAINWINLVVVGGFVVTCYILLQKGYKQKVAVMCLFLVDVAENKFGAGTGGIKYEFVQSHLYKNLPSAIRFFLTEDDIDNAIEKAVDGLQEFLENQSK